MLGLLFLGFFFLAVWTGITLMRKNTRNEDIKQLLSEIGTNIFKLIDVFMILFGNFKNLTMAPIEKDLINFDLLTFSEKNYLFKYHLDVYSKTSKYLNQNEKKWLASLI